MEEGFSAVSRAKDDSGHGGNCEVTVDCDREEGFGQESSIPATRGNRKLAVDCNREKEEGEGVGVSSLCRDCLLFRASSLAQRHCLRAISNISKQGGIGFVVQGAITLALVQCSPTCQ